MFFRIFSGTSRRSPHSPLCRANNCTGRIPHNAGGTTFCAGVLRLGLCARAASAQTLLRMTANLGCSRLRTWTDKVKALSKPGGPAYSRLDRRVGNGQPPPAARDVCAALRSLFDSYKTRAPRRTLPCTGRRHPAKTRRQRPAEMCRAPVYAESARCRRR